MNIEINEAVQKLLEGNRRFVEGRSNLHGATAFGVEMAAAQNPFAVVLGCSDSRVPIETIFDQEPGNIFVVRLAGNVVTDEGLGSIEYSVELFKSPLILVLGHSGCGAVAAAIQQVSEGAQFPGHIAKLANLIAPAATATREQPNAYEAAIAENVRRNAAALTERSSILANAVEQGTVSVRGGVYDLRTGTIALID